MNDDARRAEDGDDSQALLVDSHVHIFRRGMPMVANPRHRPDYEFTAEQLQTVLDDHGVQFCVVAAGSPWGDCNDYVIQSLRTRPRWRGTAILDPSTDRYTLERMSRDGIVGVRLPFIGQRELPDLDSWAYRKFLYRLANINWHVHLHLDGERMPLVLPLLERSGVRLVIDHIGRPDPVLGVASPGFQAVASSVEKFGTWVKLSGGHRLGPQAVDHARALCARTGIERMVWASDCPFIGAESTSYRSTMDWLAEVLPDASQRRQVGGANAFKLYFS